MFTNWSGWFFTVRERNGRFKANKVGIFYVATH